MICKKIALNEEKTAHLYTYILEPEISYGVRRKWPAMIILPGGGYLIHATKEKEAVAMQFLSHGFSCFVLEYSTFLYNREDLVKENPLCNENAYYPAQEVQLLEVIHLIKENAEQWNVDADHIFSVGFSAGAHIGGTIALRWNDPKLKERLSFVPKEQELKLKGAILCYPLVEGNPRAYMKYTKDQPGSVYYQIDHIEKCLFGHPFPTQEEMDEVSLIPFVSDETAPIFLWQTSEDVVVNSLYSTKFIAALQKQGIPCEYHLFEKGQHGLACANEYYAKNDQEVNDEIALWLPLAFNWLKHRMEGDC